MASERFVNAASQVNVYAESIGKATRQTQRLAAASAGFIVAASSLLESSRRGPGDERSQWTDSGVRSQGMR